MSEHTPGPWRIHQDPPEAAQIPRWTPTIESGRGMICRLRNLMDAEGVEHAKLDGEVQANAHLIAAAPELLSALELLMREECCVAENEEGENYVKCGRCDSSSWGSDVVDIEHYESCPFAAISKVEGL